MKRTLRVLLASALLMLSCATTASAQSVKVLVFTGPSDATTTAGVNAIKAIGTANGFGVDSTATAADMTATKLQDYRSLVFLNTAGDLLNAEQEAAVQAFVQAGNGFLGIGSAAQGESGAFFDGLIGARPASGSSTATASKVVAVGDRVSPATKDLPLTITRSDVWYQWNARVTGTVHVLARYRAPGAAAGDGTRTNDNDTPISWCRDYQGGRSFYTGMGRTPESYGEANFTKHLTGALMWTAGLSRMNCKATINSSYKGTKIVSAGAESTGLATAGESHGIATADNGWVLYIGRADCRTDQERGGLYPGGGAFGRILDHSNPRVGVGCGSVHIYDPKAANGTLNSGVTLAGKLAVYGDGGQSGERTNEADHKMEYGLLGVAPDPHFSQNGWVYLQYFPTFDPASTPPGLPVERRISKMSRPRISRFTINLQTKKLDLSSEKRIFEYDAQIYSCCHVGGGMGFDSEGNLYVTTGDTNSSQGTDGYGGVNPVAKCPIGDNTIPTSANCGTANYSYQDARRTAGNTNDYNGKMLRFNPVEIPDSAAQPTVGVGTTYTLPNADSPNGPNLFKGDETGCKDPQATSCTKPEIYAMGLRNPSRLSIDPKTDVPYTAWVGPDAGAPSRTLGPSTYENAAQITHAGNYGWPYCMGNNQPFRDYTAAGTPRTDTPAGYVQGGPANAPIPGWFDCDNLRNDSPNNTGLVVFPHQTGTGADAGKVREKNLWYSRGNKDAAGNAANGCPDYPRPTGGAPDYGSTATQLCPYAEDDGMTIMDGPVYRYDKDATDNSKRWPEYWDGRWFLQNNGGPSIKHGLLLDPATAGDGGRPVYADSLRDTLAWDGSYMDGKFGPDGAYYVQTYDGFFRAGQNVSVYRFDYVGGPATPSAAPRAVPIGDYQVRFNVGGSGGVSYKWDFGDGESSTEANPTHKYAEAKNYTATLTVTYGDGSTDKNTVDVKVLAEADETAPTTTYTLDPATPGAGGTYTQPVHITLTATDAAGGSGVDTIEYRFNGSGDWQVYTAPISRQQPGDYTLEFRATDKTGNVEATKSVAFKIAVPDNCQPSINDEFDGTALTGWTILRDTPSARSFVDGRLKMLVRDGDMIGDEATAKNVILRDAPDGSWQATTRLDVSTLTTTGDQAGFILWQKEDPNTFAKITFISKGATQQYEYVATRENASDIHAGPQISVHPTDVYLRLTANGSGTYIAEGSTDGETWQQISSPITGLGDPKTIKVGLKISNGGDSDHYAAFDYFRVDCSDKIAPITSATLSPAQPDGKLGWYSTSPKVTLAADDGAGDGVAKISYTVDGGAERAYNPEAPITTTGDGEHVISFYSTDKAGNVEQVKSTAFRVDGAAPKTAASVQMADTENGPATVTLNPEDGDKGSGAVLTQYRVDGGPWQVYQAKAEQIFDGSAASLAQWKQAPNGHFELMNDGSGGITPVDGLGMLWYPKVYSDYRLKLQFREGRTDGDHSNGGVFIRFPNIEQEPRAYPCAEQAGTDDAWVAIYCGYEIQLYDGTGTETRKTGSIYTFDNNDIDHIGPAKPVGQWEDYEIEVRGMHFTIRRNGEVIKEFENSPGKESDRGGDPTSTDRQFTEGYIGLQNHSLADLMQYRNVSVEDLSEGATPVTAAKPFQVTGKGPHTVEVRSVDAAGNVEEKTAYPFEIGSQTAPQPATPQPLIPAPANPIMPPMIDTPASYRLGRMTSKIRGRTLIKKGLKVPVQCTGAMTGTAKLTISSKDAHKLHLSRRTIKATDVRCWGPHTATVKLKPSSTIAKRLKAKRGPKRVKLTLAVRMHDWGKPSTTTRKTVTLSR